MSESVVRDYARHINPGLVKLLGVLGYGRVFEKALGTRIWDAQGREYLDCLAGYGATNLGHRHPALVQRLCDELSNHHLDLFHVGPSPSMAELGRRLAAMAGPPYQVALLSNSGGEAVESALKLARAATRRPEFLFCHGGFHGTSLGTLSVMGHPRLRRPFEPLLKGCRAIPFGDLGALQRALNGKVAAVLLEPIQAEGGVRLPPHGYLAQAQELCRSNGSLLIVDEVQTGLGRTGSWLAVHQESCCPDIVVLGKALGGGILPVSACLTSQAVHQRAYGGPHRFDLHGSTFSGYTLGCRAALATMEIIEQEGLLDNARERGAQLLNGLSRVLRGHPWVRQVRGRGLLVAIELGWSNDHTWWDRMAGKLTQPLCRQLFGQWLALCLLERGILCQTAALRWDVLKIEPALVVSHHEVERIVTQVGEVLDTYRRLPTLLSHVARRVTDQARRGWVFP